VTQAGSEYQKQMADSSKESKTVVAGALGECVHVAGVLGFLRLAADAGWRTVFLGPAVSVAEMIGAARRETAQLVGVSYRLTPQTGEQLLARFAEEADELRASGVRFLFGGTPPVAERARALGFFEQAFDGTEPREALLDVLSGHRGEGQQDAGYPQTLMRRISWKAPYPVLRHHFGLPTVEATRDSVARIAESRLLDIISLGTDQDAQASFFHPEEQSVHRRGAGGVPVRSAEDYRALYEASRRGNYPLMRTYSGTRDFIRLAEMYVETISTAWCAIPIFWFNQMDGRGPWDLEGSIRKHQEVMAWYGERSIPVELNEPHHWGMRDAPDVVSVVSGYLSAYNARAFGVGDYIAALMFNSPAGLSDRMDLAKMLAILEMTESMAGPRFRILRQTRTGLLSYPVDMAAARAHLATSIYVQMALLPHIVHVVGHTEAHHAATAEDVVEACRLARRAIENALGGQPDMLADPQVQERKEELISEAGVTLEAIRSLAPSDVSDPLADPGTLARAVTSGLLDAPHLRGNPFALGEIATTIDERGACVAIDPGTGDALREEQRVAGLRLEAKP
jgi:methylmalonyl-CoA mutase cobalamin-binding subunit